jgi:hypothetical protein
MKQARMVNEVWGTVAVDKYLFYLFGDFANRSLKFHLRVGMQGRGFGGPPSRELTKRQKGY